MDPLQSICPVNSSSFINTSLSLSSKYLFRPTSSHTLTLSRHINFIPLFLSPSSFLNQLFLLPPFPFFRRYFYQPPLRYIEFGYFFFLLSIPDQTELNSAPLFSPLFLLVFSLLTVDCCISLVSPPRFPVPDQIARSLADPWNNNKNNNT